MADGVRIPVVGVMVRNRVVDGKSRVEVLVEFEDPGTSRMEWHLLRSWPMESFSDGVVSEIFEPLGILDAEKDPTARGVVVSWRDCGVAIPANPFAYGPGARDSS